MRWTGNVSHIIKSSVQGRGHTVPDQHAYHANCGTLNWQMASLLGDHHGSGIGRHFVPSRHLLSGWHQQRLPTGHYTVIDCFCCNQYLSLTCIYILMYRCMESKQRNAMWHIDQNQTQQAFYKCIDAACEVQSKLFCVTVALR